MNTESLQYFIAVYDAKNLNVAAESIGITRQGLSASLRQLEKRFSVVLFNYTSGGVEPTAFARDLYDIAQKILKLEADANELALSYRRKHSGEIKFGLLGDNVFSHMVGFAIGDWMGLNPGIAVSTAQFDSNDPDALFSALDNGAIDFGWMFNTSKREGYEYHTLRTVRIDLLVGPDCPLAQKSDLRWADIAPYKLILPGQNDSYTVILRDYISSHGHVLDPSQIIYTTDAMAIADFVEAGRAVMAVNKFYFSNIQPMCAGSRLLPIGPELRMSLSFINKKGKALTAGEQALLGYLVGIFQGNITNF